MGLDTLTRTHDYRESGHTVIGTLAATMAFLRETMRGWAMRDSTSRSSCIALPGCSQSTRVDYWTTSKMASTLAGLTPASRLA
jgi:hypothetical protein